MQGDFAINAATAATSRDFQLGIAKVGADVGAAAVRTQIVRIRIVRVAVPLHTCITHRSVGEVTGAVATRVFVHGYHKVA